ncbi:ATP-binding cassette domain-containing protein [Bacillus cereus group sp. BfR-BA-01316]|uniref:ATP-binding cassette domain-containing protein n=1 Tax=Bacillus cereus group sp. BfR-BA-01316 TaxID=2920293 RepID=UPI001F55D47F|nr:ATP-binding cassette domain-containing protein [Bacillus cereus group sp. BfR-BA-01316]
MINEQAIVKVDRLTKRIGSKTLVENISFEVKKGEVVGLLGPNGAGKTTLMRMMVGMIRMTEGEVWIDGQSVKQQFEKTAAKIAHEQGKAVLVSSHLLSEVELMCDRVIIIQHGEYVATQNIQSDKKEETEKIHIRVDDANKAAEVLEYDVLVKGNELIINVKDEEIPNVLRTLIEKNIQVYRVYEERKTLEEQFLELTGGKDIV